MEKPDVDVIEGLSPAISIDQKGVSHNPRSTVGTVTEVYDYLRLLFARVGRPHCPNCGKEISPQTPQQIVDSILSLPENTKVMLLAPVVRGRKGHHKNVLEEIRRAGYVRARIDGKIMELDEEIELDRYKLHTIEAVVDRLVIHHSEDEDYRSRLADSVETALKFGNGVIVVSIMEEGGYRDLLFSEHSACIDCGISLPEIEPRTFSFNSPHGACPHCSGLGVIMEIDPDLVIPDKSLSLKDGAIAPWRYLGKETSRYYMHLLRRVCEFYKIPMNVPVRELTKEQLDIILYGTRPGELVSLPYSDQYGRTHYYEIPYEGVIPNLQRRYRETESDYIRSEIERYMTARTCPVCNGTRLRPEALAVTVDGKNIAEVAAMSVTQALEWVERLQGPDSPLTEKERLIAHQILKELRNRLRFMVDVGLDYITLDRRASTLSGGEAQRIRLATQIGSQLAGVLYILDEPSVGLHQRDNARLIQTLKHLRDLGNTVIVVEHDENTIRSADYIIDLGPGAGDKGGEVVVAGTLDDLLRCPRSITGMYLRGERKIEVPKSRRPGNGYFLTVHGAAENNLKNITVRFPLGTFICVTGVSGSGKSSLVIEVLYKALAQKLYRAREKPGKHLFIEGIEHIDKVVNVDQSPIGRTPRSNPATYTGAFTPIRELFASLPEARLRGYTPGRFSFNVKGGRCEACEGAGIIRIEMQFLPDVYVPCDVCKGKRYNRETLEIRYKGKNISEVLDMTVEEAMEFFGNIPQIKAKLQTLYDVGLGYIKLGQPAPTLSGGEAQRVKLARELSRRATGRTLYILDEPTTGLHFADIEKLLNVLNRLVDAGNTVIVIEHNLDVIKCADWIIDLGPEGGDRGGWVIAEGTPEEVAMVPHSYTGQFLKKVLFPEEAKQCAYL
jgi:excinuclease ABC subunit A